MLFNPLLKQKIVNFFQSSLYFDYIVKKTTEIFVKNIFIYSGIFFGEKFLIEYLTKKLIDNLILMLNNSFFTKNFSFNFFFLQIIHFFFITIFALNIFFFFFI